MHNDGKWIMHVEHPNSPLKQLFKIPTLYSALRIILEKKMFLKK